MTVAVRPAPMARRLLRPDAVPPSGAGCSGRSGSGHLVRAAVLVPAGVGSAAGSSSPGEPTSLIGTTSAPPRAATRASTRVDATTTGPWGSGSSARLREARVDAADASALAPGVEPPGTKLLSGEVTICSGGTQVAWPPQAVAVLDAVEAAAGVVRGFGDGQAVEARAEPVHGERRHDQALEDVVAGSAGPAACCRSRPGPSAQPRPASERARTRRRLVMRVRAERLAAVAVGDRHAPVAAEGARA